MGFEISHDLPESERTSNDGRTPARDRGAAQRRPRAQRLVQRKLLVGSGNDPSEREADHVADAVVGLLGRLHDPGVVGFPPRAFSAATRICPVDEHAAFDHPARRHPQGSVGPRRRPGHARTRRFRAADQADFRPGQVAGDQGPDRSRAEIRQSGSPGADVQHVRPRLHPRSARMARQRSDTR